MRLEKMGGETDSAGELTSEFYRLRGRLAHEECRLAVCSDLPAGIIRCLFQQ
jgi:hypothetical protein